VVWICNIGRAVYEKTIVMKRLCSFISVTVIIPEMQCYFSNENDNEKDYILLNENINKNER